MNNNVAGIHVFRTKCSEARNQTKKGQAGITGVEIAAYHQECKPYCPDCAHIMALGWESKIPDLLKLAEI